MNMPLRRTTLTHGPDDRLTDLCAGDTGLLPARRRLVNVPTVYCRDEYQLKDTMDRLTLRLPTIDFPAAWLARYGPSVRAGYRFAAVLQNDSYLLYSLRGDGQLAVLEAVLTIRRER